MTPRTGTARRANSNTWSAEALTRAAEPIPPPILVSYHQDPLAALAQHLIANHGATLPDLSRCVVLLPTLLDAPRLRRCLLDAAIVRGHQALMGPTILTLRQWLNIISPPVQASLSPHAQELILVETLSRHRGLFKDSDPWLLASNLLALFSQLTLHRITLPSELDSFIARLTHAYRLGNHTLSALSAEASLVHTLWHAWHRQLHEEGQLDPEASYIRQLNDSLITLPTDTSVYMTGYLALTPPEQHWVSILTERGQLTTLIQGVDERPEKPRPCPADIAYTDYLDQVFAGMTTGDDVLPLRERAIQFAARHTVNPARQRLFAYIAPDSEAEARAVDLQIRRWLLQGKRRIAIISDDRRLARRVRALLERADVALYDTAGWALSTTAAAAVLIRWLEALEEDFAYQPLTDLLKSPFVFPAKDRMELSNAVYRFEQDLVIHENIPRNLQRYRKHLTYRRDRLPQATGKAVASLLDDIETAAKPLLPLLRGDRSLPPQRWLDALNQSLERLGLTTSFARDAAGERVLQELQIMRQSVVGRTLKMNWREFRTWLGRTLERFNFQPPSNGAAVYLLGLEQSALTHCDALILAGATTQHLPGMGEPSPFFNEAVRAELGLPGFKQRYAERFYYFRRMLQAAPQILMTASLEERGEPTLLSPWVEAIQTFQYCAYGTKLSDDGLALLVEQPATRVIRSDDSGLPLASSMPAPPAPAELLPKKFSATAYQQLMNCPYQFFAAHCLNLAAPETVREALEKSDYGKRIHTVLQAFHTGAEGRPEPFLQPITTANREEALQRLEEISRAIFAADLEDNFMHRGWLHRWLLLIPHYIDWQIERAQHWRVAATEITLESRHGEVDIKGRIDRLDQGVSGYAIVDYKTGFTPRTADILTGEEIQLPFYALLSNKSISQVEYLRLATSDFGSKGLVQGEELQNLVAGCSQRLREIVSSLTQGTPLPAWGDEDTCRHCAMAGLCRREVWIKPENPDTADSIGC